MIPSAYVFYHGNAEVVRANSPVGAEISTWGNAANTWGTAEPQTGDTWIMSRQEPEEAWGDHTGSLLQPPGPAHGILPTIPEQASEYNQHGRSLSDIGESRGSQGYSSTYDSRQDSPEPRYAEGQQNQNLTATAAPSAIGSPRPPPVISITEAAQSLIGQKANSASEAARRLEEQRSRLNAHPIHAPGTSPAIHFEPLKDHSSYMAGGQTPMSSASAAAALHESTANRLRAQTNKASKPVQPTVPAPPGKTTWTYPKTLTPGSRPAAAIPPDYSWTMTGGNEWSNKHRQTKSATVHWSQGNADDAWGQQMPQQGQQIPQHMHQGQPARSQAQQRPQHQKHLSHPVHPTQQQRLPPGQNTSWQGWGRDGWQEERSESGTDEDDIYDEWDRGGGDAWGQQGGSGHQRGGWGEQKQNQQHAHPPRQGDQKQQGGRGRGEKPANDQWEQDEWGRGGQSGNGWDQGDAGWGQSNDGWPQGRGHGQQAHGQGRGQAQGQGRGQGRGEGRGQIQSENGWGQQEDNGWGQHESAWNKADGDGWGKASDGGWGKASDAGWGQGNGEWQTGGRASPVEWATAQQKPAAHGAADPAMMARTMAEQHKVQIMNAMLNQAPNQKNHNMTTAQHQAAQLHHAQLQAQLAAAQGAKLPPKATAKESNVWEAYDADNGWGSINSSDGEYDVDRRVHFSPKRSDLWGGSPRSLPSKTLAQAQQQQGIAATTINLPSGVRFVESKGAAFSFVHNAFFGNARLARERIHWMFPANKDERVANMLAWVQKMSFNLATFGVRFSFYPLPFPLKVTHLPIRS